jgi:hypothetical protein
LLVFPHLHGRIFRPSSIIDPFLAAGCPAWFREAVPDVLRYHRLLFDSLPSAPNADSQEQPEDEQGGVIPPVDEIHPTFGDLSPVSGEHTEVRHFFQVPIEATSAMTFSADIRPVDLQTRLRQAVLCKVGEELAFNLRLELGSHPGCVAKVIGHDILAG